MKYFIVDNFIDKELCERLIQASEKYNNIEKKNEIHGGRQFLSSTSLEFNKLLKNSKDWADLESKINSKEFLEFCINKLELKNKKFSLVNYFKQKKFTKFKKLYKQSSNTPAKLISKKNLIIYFFLRVYRDALRKIKFSKLFYPNKNAVELLFDYSKAGNGYSRKIHRDSDNRLVVFLIYLNSPSKDDNHEGGNFDIYRIINGIKNIAYPNKEDCKIIESIKPSPGQLIVFLNNDESYHGVGQMKNHSEYRHFIYGGFTLLNKKNPYISNKSNIDTEFHLYD